MIIRTMCFSKYFHINEYKIIELMNIKSLNIKIQ